MRRVAFLSLPSFLLFACASAPEEQASGRSGDPIPVQASYSYVAEDAQETVGDAPATPPVLRTQVSGDPELSIWRDPRFQRLFRESYMAETEIEPRVTVIELEVMEEFRELMGNEERAEAFELIQENRGPATNAVFDFTLANLLVEQERFDEALEVLAVAVDKHPKFRRAWQNIGVISFEQGDYETALPALTKVVELGGGNALIYGLLGFIYSSSENHVAAETAYRMAILLDPETLEWQMRLSRTLLLQERWADTAALCDALIAEHSDNKTLWLIQATAFIGQGQPLRAAENYELLDQLGMSTVASLENLGDIYANEKLFALSVDCYVRALEKSDDASPDRAIRAAKFLVDFGAYDECRVLLEGLDRLRGDELEVADRTKLLKMRASIALAEGATDEEARILEKVVELDPLDGRAFILLGRHAGREGEVEQAAFYFERAAALEEYEAEAKLRHAQLLAGEGRYVEALPLVKRAYDLEPKSHVQNFLDQVERAAAQGR